MILKIISALLILVTMFFSLKHGVAGITNNLKPTEVKMMSDIGIGHNIILLIAILSLLVAALVVFPQTFFIANFINAIIILMIMAFALKAGNIKTVLIEIPFLLMPLIMIYLGHPLKK